MSKCAKIGYVGVRVQAKHCKKKRIRSNIVSNKQEDLHSQKFHLDQTFDICY